MWCVEVYDEEKGPRSYVYEHRWQAGQMMAVLQWQAQHQGIEREVTIRTLPPE